MGWNLLQTTEILRFLPEAFTESTSLVVVKNTGYTVSCGPITAKVLDPSPTGLWIQGCLTWAESLKLMPWCSWSRDEAYSGLTGVAVGINIIRRTQLKALATKILRAWKEECLHPEQIYSIYSKPESDSELHTLCHILQTYRKSKGKMFKLNIFAKINRKNPTSIN